MGEMTQSPTKIYVASSWRNTLQPTVVEYLRSLGCDVYDFRNPPGATGFSWSQVQSDWKPGSLVDATTQRALTASPTAELGYGSDIAALSACELCVYVLPCGRSASWECGFAMGQGKPSAVLWTGLHEPELMFREATIVGSLEELGAWVSQNAKWQRGPLPSVESGRVLVLDYMDDEPPERYRQNTADSKIAGWWMGPIRRMPGEHHPSIWRWRLEADDQ